MLKPQDKCGPLPEQSAVMRVENSLIVLRQILPEPLYKQVRYHAAQWDLRSDPGWANSEGLLKAWAKRKAG